MPRRRVESRKTLICRISVIWVAQEGAITTLTGFLEDRSRFGVGISLPEPIPVGTAVKIQGRMRELHRIVRHCRYEGGQYLVGVHLDAEDKAWDRFGVGL